jgi:hypothetical protein
MGLNSNKESSECVLFIQEEASMGPRAGAMFVLLVILSFTLPSIGLAQDGGKTTMSGFVDTYYCFSLQDHPLRARSFTTQPLRHDEFNLNLGFLALTHQSDDIRGRFALQTGTYVESNLAAEPALLKHVLEASIGSRVGRHVWVDIGIFPSHIGLEGIVSKENWTYTRSILADYSPYYEAGISITAILSDQVTVRGLIINGWQNIAETNNGKAIGSQIQFRPSNQVLLNWSSFVGNEEPDSLPSRLRVFNDLYGLLTLSEHWCAAVILDIGAERNSSGTSYDVWYAGSFMGRVAFNDHWALAARLEYYADGKGVIIPTGTPNNFQTIGASVNVDYAPASNLLWRVEVRQFSSKDPVYPTLAGLQHTDGFIVLSAAISL